MSVLRLPPAVQRERANMPPVRNQAVRTKPVNRRKTGGRSGVAARVASDLATRYRDIASLWFAATNDPQWSYDAIGGEFIALVGDIMMGTPLHLLKFTRISRERALAHAKE